MIGKIRVNVVGYLPIRAKGGVFHRDPGSSFSRTLLVSTCCKEVCNHSWRFYAQARRGAVYGAETRLELLVHDRRESFSGRDQRVSLAPSQCVEKLGRVL